jgi:hypothetical protein
MAIAKSRLERDATRQVDVPHIQRREDGASSRATSGRKDGILLLGSWVFVGIPLAWGVWTTLLKAAALFQ